jgi:hypothetical protein
MTGCHGMGILEGEDGPMGLHRLGDDSVYTEHAPWVPIRCWTTPEVGGVLVPFRAVALGAEDLKVGQFVLPAARTRENVVHIERPLILGDPTKGAAPPRGPERLIAEIIRDGVQFEEAVIPEGEVPLLDELLEPLLAGALQLCPLDVTEVGYGQ